MVPANLPVGATILTVPDLMAIARKGEFPPTPSTMIRMIDRVLERGFTALEILLDILNWHPEVFDKTVIRRLQRAHDAEGLRLTSHLPFHNLNTTTHVEEVRKASVENLIHAIRHVEDLPMENFVLHMTGAARQGFIADHELPQNAFQFMKENILSQGNRTIEELLSVVDNGRLLVENLPSVPIEFPKEWAKRWDLSFCLDIGHVLLRKGDLHRTIDEVKSEFRIQEYHVHDVIETPEKKRSDHKTLGTGMIDFARLAQQVYAENTAPIVILEAPFEYSEKSLPIWRGIIEQQSGQPVPTK